MRLKFALLAGIIFAVSFAARANAQADVPAPLALLQQTLRSAAATAPGFAAYAVRDLATGYTSGYNMNAIMPAASTITGPTGELDSLIANLCSTTACNSLARVQAVTAAVCAAALGNANMLIN